MNNTTVYNLKQAIAKNGKWILLFFGALLLLLAILPFAHGAYSFTKTVTFTKDIQITIDGNTVQITSGSFSWGRSVDGGTYSTTISVPLAVDVNQDYCPTLNEVYTPLFDAFNRCDANLNLASKRCDENVMAALRQSDANLLLELEKAKTELTNNVGRIDTNEMQSLLLVFGQDINARNQLFLTSWDSVMSQKFDDYWAKIENTLVPNVTELSVLKNQANACEVDKTQKVSDLNAYWQICLADNKACREDVVPAKQSQVDFFEIISLCLFVAVLLFLANYLGIFDRFKGEGGFT